ncbi:MAG: hypothetical protein Q4E01_06490 [Actinomycetaceae bacterium]|nr:hypothetical protein [Actinomycetaceae bacterium]
MTEKNLMDRTIKEFFGYVLTPEENEMYSDEDLERKLAELGFPKAGPNVIPRLRGEVSWQYVEFYE